MERKLSFADKLSYPHNGYFSNTADLGGSLGCIPRAVASGLKAFLDRKRCGSASEDPVPGSQPRLLWRDGRRMLGMCRLRSALSGRSTSCSS